MRDIPQAIIDALDDGVFRPLYLVEIQFDTPLMFSSTYAEITVGGKTYFGGGNLGSVSSFRENSSLEPNQLEITLAGISDAALAAVGDSNYLNRDVVIRMAMLDENGQPLGDGATFNYFVGKTDEVRFSYGKASAITVIARDKLADWSRVKTEKNVNAYHQARYPGDKGFEFVAQVADKKIIWPSGEFFE
jgi:hypothetical protein